MKARLSTIALVAVAAIGMAAASFATPGLPRLFADKRPNAIPVDVELVLAVDVSYSMDPAEQALQREGYIRALTSAEFLRALRRLPGGDRPKVVFCTTENDVAHIARALHAGANEYIMKPFDKDIVESKFQEVGLL